MATQAELLYVIRAQDRDLRRLKGEVRELNRELGRTGSEGARSLSDRMRDAGESMAAAGRKATKRLTVPLVALGATAFKMGMDFDTSMNKVQALTGATGDEFQALRDQALELGRTTSFSASQAAEAQAFLGMAGFKTNEILKVMPGTLNLAAAGQMDIARTADIASNVLTGFGMKAGQMNRVADVMAKTMATTNTDMEQLGEAMKYVAPVAASAGVEFEETAAAIGLMGNAGIQGSMAGTSLRSAISRLLSPTAAVQKTMDRLGISATDSRGNLLPLHKIISQLERSGASTADMMTIFGQRAGPAMAALVSQGSKALREQTEATRDAGGTAERIAKTQMQGLVGMWVQMKSAFEGFMISLYDAGLGDMLLGFADAASRVLATFASLSPELRRIIVIVAGLAAAIGPMLVVFGKTITIVGNTMAGVNSLGKALHFLQAHPIVLVIAAVAALAAGLVYAYKNSETFRRIVDGAISAVGKTIGAFAKFFSESIPNAAKAVLDWIKRNWPAIATIISGPFAPLVALATDAFGIRSKLIGAFTSLINSAKSKASELARGIWSSITSVASSVWNFAKLLTDRIIKPIVDRMGDVLERAKDLSGQIPKGIRAVTWGLLETFRDRIIQPLINLATSAFAKGKDLARDIGRGIREGAAAAWDGVRNAFRALLNRIIDVVNKVPFVNIPKLAEGGVIAGPTLAVVGEDGPEVVIPLSRKRRRRGMELMTRAATIMGMEGDWPGPVSRARGMGIPFLANGGFVIPGQYQGAGLDALYRSVLEAQNRPNLLQRAAGVLSRGVGWVLGQLPTPAVGNPVLDGLGRAVREAATTTIRNAFGAAQKHNIDGILAARTWAISQMGKPYVWGGGHAGWNFNLPGYDCCLVGETRVFGPDGVKRMDQLAPGDMVWSFVDGRLEAHRVTAAWFSKRQTVYAVRTRNRTVLASDNHPFLRIACTKPSRGGFAGPAEWNTEWARTDELAPGDLVVQLGDAPHTGETQVDLDLAWLAGLAVGDGTLTDKGLRLCVYGEARERADTIIRERTGARPFWRDDAGLVVSSAALRDELLAIGLQRARSHEKRVPAAVWRWREDAQRAFLDGYRDADGYSPKDQRRHGERTYASSSHDLVAEVRALHILLGDAVSNISTNQRRSPITIKGVLVKRARPLHSFTVWQAGARDGMHAVRSKQGLRRLLEEWGGRFVIARVLDITEMGKRDTFDIEVAGSHNFVADGLVVHNSGFASHVAKKAGSSIGAPGTTMSLFPVAKPGRGPVMWGFRNMHIPDPRKQHMGARVLGTWYQFGNPGRAGGGDGQWNSLRVPPGLASYQHGTAYVPETGPALLHRGEKVVPAHGALVRIDNVTVQRESDIDVIAARLSRKLALQGVG